jgi:peptide/nickel transport system substrate-binding protein
MNKKDVLCREFLRGKVSRRDFNVGLLNMGLSVAAASALVSKTMSEAMAATPKKGGRLRFASTSSGPSDHLDPHKSTSGPDISSNILLYDRLVDRDLEGNLVPVLADSWEASDAVDEWVIHLRQGVEFHNGKTLTSADVKWSLERILNADTGSPAQPLIKDIAEVSTDGKNTVRLKLSQANADLMYALNEYHVAIVPEGQDDYTGTPAGTGPWKVQSFEPGMGALFVRNENYFVSGRPYIDEVEVFGIPDNTARINALLANEVDVIASVDPQLTGLINDASNAELLTIAGSAHPTYPMRADTEPYTDNNVRLAMKSAIDREKFVELAFNGLASPGRDHPVPVHDPMHCDEIPIPQFDPDKAMFHLKKAGHQNTVFELSASDSTYGGLNASLILIDMVNDAGINAKVKRVPTDGYWSDVWLKAPWCGSNWYGRPTAALVMAVTYASTAKWNESHWIEPKLDALLAESNRTADPVKRKEILCEAQWLIHSEGSTLVPVFSNWIDAKSTRIKNLVPHPDGFAGWMQWDDAWIDS